MKITAFILVFYVGSLSFMPVLGIVDLLPQENCCLQVCADDRGDHQEEESGACSDSCNPFLSCQCCLGFTTSSDEDPGSADLTLYGASHSRIRQFHSSQVIRPVWHPPQG